jgi:hypothetical protein
MRHSELAKTGNRGDPTRPNTGKSVRRYCAFGTALLPLRGHPWENRSGCQSLHARPKLVLRNSAIIPPVLLFPFHDTFSQTIGNL